MERMYRFLNREKEARVCNGITEKACIHAHKNYFVIIATNVLTQLGDVLSAPKTVLIWIMGSLGAPVFLTSLLVPIRESGSMLPQYFLSSVFNNMPLRKWGWIIGALVQAFSLFGIVFVVNLFSGAHAGIWIIVLVALFSLGRALCSLLSKDVIGKTIPKTRRGKLNGYSSSLSGVLVLISAVILLFHPIENAALPALAKLVAIAGSLWIIATLMYAQIIEYPNERKDEIKKNTRSFFSLIKKDTTLQKFIIARGLLISSALMSPFVILLSQKYIGTDLYILGLFILSGGLASIVSGPIWGYLADISSKKVIIRAASIVAVTSIAIVILLSLKSTLIQSLWIYPVILFILNIAHDGIRLGRKTYILDIAEGETRTQYVATSNTVIGMLLLVIGFFTAWLGSVSLVSAIAVLTLMVLAGIWVSSGLREVGE
ncbi:MAG: hypothetical protein ACI870_000327 [Crocinitomicaceae bacterium]|jgi:hypothetical protein